jgi:hypothetical protein
LKTKKKAKKRAKEKPEKNEKRKHFVKGWTLRLSRFLSKKILPVGWRLFLQNLKGLTLQSESGKP